MMMMITLCSNWFSLKLEIRCMSVALKNGWRLLHWVRMRTQQWQRLPVVFIQVAIAFHHHSRRGSTQGHGRTSVRRGIPCRSCRSTLAPAHGLSVTARNFAGAQPSLLHWYSLPGRREAIFCKFEPDRRSQTFSGQSVGARIIHDWSPSFISKGNTATGTQWSCSSVIGYFVQKQTRCGDTRPIVAAVVTISWAKTRYKIRNVIRAFR